MVNDHGICVPLAIPESTAMYNRKPTKAVKKSPKK